MALEEFQKQSTWEEQIQDILVRINRKFEVLYAKWTNDARQFEAKFRTQIPRDNEDFNALCDEWVDAFSEVTDSVWAKKISNTGPKIRFRKQYQCWTHEGKIIQKELLFDARKCKATLDIKVLQDNPISRRKNKHIRLGLNVVVKLNFFHLHAVDLNRPYGFFVHKCEPQHNLPPPVIQPNPRLPELVAAMVQNGSNISKKAAEQAEQSLSATLNNTPATTTTHYNQIEMSQTQTTTTTVNGVQYIADNAIGTTATINCMPAGQVVPLTTLTSPEQFSFETIQNISMIQPTIMQQQNISIQPTLMQQQFIVTPQFDLTQHLLMSQPVVFDTSQVIPLSNQNITTSYHHQFVPILSRIDGQNSENGSLL